MAKRKIKERQTYVRKCNVDLLCTGTSSPRAQITKGFRYWANQYNERTEKYRIIADNKRPLWYDSYYFQIIPKKNHEKRKTSVDVRSDSSIGIDSELSNIGKSNGPIGEGSQEDQA